MGEEHIYTSHIDMYVPNLPQCSAFSSPIDLIVHLPTSSWPTKCFQCQLSLTPICRNEAPFDPNNHQMHSSIRPQYSITMQHYTMMSMEPSTTTTYISHSHKWSFISSTFIGDGVCLIICYAEQLPVVILMTKGKSNPDVILDKAPNPQDPYNSMGQGNCVQCFGGLSSAQSVGTHRKRAHV